MTTPYTPPLLHRHAIVTTPTLPPYEGPLYEYWLHGGGSRCAPNGPSCTPVFR